jgi:hypothetical protein
MIEPQFIGPVGNDFILSLKYFTESFILMLPICFLMSKK